VPSMPRRKGARHGKTLRHFRTHTHVSSFASTPLMTHPRLISCLCPRTRAETCYCWIPVMAVTYNRYPYKFVTFSPPKRLQNGRFNSETATWIQKRLKMPVGTSRPTTLRMLLSFAIAGRLIGIATLHCVSLPTRSASCLLNFLWISACIS
jgi:hypothetical protein